MKRVFLLLLALGFTITSSQAGILRNVFGYGQNYANGYYYNPNIRYTNGSYYQPQPYYGNDYYNNNYYSRPYYSPYQGNYYNNVPYGNYYQPPTIYRTNVIRKKSMVENGEKLVADFKLSGIDKIEKQILLQTYDYDSDKIRIERLEQKLFGASQSGDLYERLLCLKSAVKNYKLYNPSQQMEQSYNSQYRPPIYTGSTGNNWRNNLWSNFKNQFIGMPTGFTPAMDPAYMDYFEAERAMAGNGEEVDVQTNQGYYSSKNNRGARTGVTILD